MTALKIWTLSACAFLCCKFDFGTKIGSVKNRIYPYQAIKISATDLGVLTYRYIRAGAINGPVEY